jgi:hypothetical protein
LTGAKIVLLLIQSRGSRSNVASTCIEQQQPKLRNMAHRHVQLGRSTRNTRQIAARDHGLKSWKMDHQLGVVAYWDQHGLERVAADDDCRTDGALSEGQLRTVPSRQASQRKRGRELECANVAP